VLVPLRLAAHLLPEADLLVVAMCGARRPAGGPTSAVKHGRLRDGYLAEEDLLLLIAHGVEHLGRLVQSAVARHGRVNILRHLNPASDRQLELRLAAGRRGGPDCHEAVLLLLKLRLALDIARHECLHPRLLLLRQLPLRLNDCRGLRVELLHRFGARVLDGFELRGLSFRASPLVEGLVHDYRYRSVAGLLRGAPRRVRLVGPLLLLCGRAGAAGPLRAALPRLRRVLPLGSAIPQHVSLLLQQLQLVLHRVLDALIRGLSRLGRQCLEGRVGRLCIPLRLLFLCQALLQRDQLRLDLCAPLALTLCCLHLLDLQLLPGVRHLPRILHS
jgi:hypothetical protein